MIIFICGYCDRNNLHYLKLTTSLPNEEYDDDYNMYCYYNADAVDVSKLNTDFFNLINFNDTSRFTCWHSGDEEDAKAYDKHILEKCINKLAGIN